MLYFEQSNPKGAKSYILWNHLKYYGSFFFGQLHTETWTMKIMSLFEWRMKFCYRFLLLSFLFSSFFPECICTTLGIKKQNLTDPDNSTAGLIKDRHGTGGLSIMYVVFTIPRLYFFVSFCRPLLSTGGVT